MPLNSHASGLPPDVAATVVTVGTFDGVHSGHRHVLQLLAQRARERGTRSVLITFEPHPLEIVNPEAAPRLLTVGDEKLEVLAETGIDYLAVVPFTPAVARLTADEFVSECLVQRFRVGHLLMGPDHRFGRNRSGDPQALRQLGEQRGFSVELVNPVVTARGEAISSTHIRRAVAGGDLARAAEALGRPYSIGGTVVAGEQRGRTIGVPTINLPLHPRKLLPPLGVYAARVQTRYGSYGAMVNLGGRPTVGEGGILLEAHLFDVSHDFYGARVRVDLVERLRDIQRFAGLDTLRQQLKQDEINARRLLAEVL